MIFLYNLQFLIVYMVYSIIGFILGPTVVLGEFSTLAVTIWGFLLFGLIVGLGVWLCIFLGCLPARIARRRGLPWGRWMSLIGFILLLSTFIGWLILLIVALIKDPPAEKIVYYVKKDEDQ